MLDLVLEFVRLLRIAGLRVGLTETQDALQALLLLDGQLDCMRTALKATLIKRKADEEIFERVFNLFFNVEVQRRIPHTLLSFQVDAGEGQGDLPSGSSGTHRAAASYKGALERAAQLILRYAYRADDPHAARRTQEAIALMSHMVHRRAQSTKTLEEVRSDIERAFLHRAHDAEALAALLQPADFEDLEFARLDETEAELVEREVERLLAELTWQPQRRYRRQRQGRTDIRRTIRKSLQYGGTPIKVALKKRRMKEPKVFVLADVSSSVAAFTRFFLILARAFHVTADICRSFVFVDQVREVTDWLEAEQARTARPGRAIEKVFKRLRSEGWGLSHSDYGTALRQFYSQWGSEVDRHSMIVILGDARTNYTAPQAQWLQRLREQAHSVIWLNPERQSFWDSGDSVMSLYAPYCDRVLECRTVEQLRRVVREITSFPRLTK